MNIVNGVPEYKGVLVSRNAEVDDRWEEEEEEEERENVVTIIILLLSNYSASLC